MISLAGKKQQSSCCK